jgi:hypothetical protein
MCLTAGVLNRNIYCDPLRIFFWSFGYTSVKTALASEEGSSFEYSMMSKLGSDSNCNYSGDLDKIAITLSSNMAGMTELAFARQFLTALDSRPIKLSSDHVADPKNYPAQGAVCQIVP